MASQRHRTIKKNEQCAVDNIADNECLGAQEYEASYNSWARREDCQDLHMQRWLPIAMVDHSWRRHVCSGHISIASRAVAYLRTSEMASAARFFCYFAVRDVCCSVEQENFEFTGFLVCRRMF